MRLEKAEKEITANKTISSDPKTARLCGIRFAQFYRKPTLFFGPVMVGVRRTTLNTAEHEEVVIRRKDGRSFSIVAKTMKSSPFDVPGIKTKATTKDILSAISESRSRKF